MNANRKVASTFDPAVWAFAACAIFFVAVLVSAFDQPVNASTAAINMQNTTSSSSTAQKSTADTPPILIDAVLMGGSGGKMAQPAKPHIYQKDA